MKKIIMAICLLTSSMSLATSEVKLVEILESALRFDGYVEIAKVSKLGSYTIVDFYVGAYGEERPTQCILKDESLLECKDNWFKL